MKLTLVLLAAFLLSCNYVAGQQKVRLNNNWEFLKQDIGGIWEAIRPVGKGNPESVPIWTSVTLPHCVNAEDAVDPDVHYYQGPSWYRTQLEIKNPYSKGRTLLHFEGAGQKSEVYVYDIKVGSHIGGYDEWTVDITDAVEAFKKSDVFQKQFKGKVPLSIRTDNSRDLELIPSDLSDFNLYGGLYRDVNLVYTPALSIDKIFALTETDAQGKSGKLTVKARVHNPLNVGSATFSVKLIDTKGKVIQQTSNVISSLKDDITLSEFTIKSPQVWSTENPILYTVEVDVKNGEEIHKHEEKIGFRHFEFVKKGPFMLNGKRLLLREHIVMRIMPV